uniref:RNA-directed DNA polymerase, eukaryota n=1 Tax=Tanacetum cinerariifolium TaxID=118510 RepID=A0A699H5G4_TANCI|nr:RNA-directed DNA polymerase, eukaryota [Tanacetum cinerariifolium]
MGDGNWKSYRFKEDQTQSISQSVFEANFPDHVTAHDFWKCEMIMESLWMLSFLIRNLKHVNYLLSSGLLREHKTYAPSHPFNANVRNSQGSFVSILKLDKTNNVMSRKETKMKSMELVIIKTLWGNSSFDYALSSSLGNSGRFKKVHLAIEGDENTKFFHGILNSKRSRFAIRESRVDGEWIVDPLVVKSLFSSIPIDSSLTFFHLFFADDDIFVGIDTRPKEVDASAKTTDCLIFTTPFVHLGVKFGGAMYRIKSWDDLVAKVSFRLSNWKLKTLSIGGRLTLIKLVLTSIPSYHMSIFKFPLGALKLLESIRRNFVNRVDGSKIKMAWISWNKILPSKKYSGLIVSSIYALNRAFLFKWVWRFFFSWFLSMDEIHNSYLCWQKIDHASMVDTFRHPPRGGAEEEQLTFLLSHIGGLILTNISNRWVWSIEDTDEFSVIFVRQLLDDSILPMRKSH